MSRNSNGVQGVAGSNPAVPILPPARGTAANRSAGLSPAALASLEPCGQIPPSRFCIAWRRYYSCRFRIAYSATAPKTAPMAAPVRVLRVVGHGTPLSQCIRTLAQPIAPPTIAPMVAPVTPCGRPELDADFKCAPTIGTAENPSRARNGSPLGATSEICRPATSGRTLSFLKRV